MNIKELIENNEGTIVDVRTVMEFNGGHPHGAINIPVQNFVESIDQIKQLKAPIILCCASGGRSHQAFRYLTQMGINCVDAGPWQNVFQYQSK